MQFNEWKNYFLQNRSHFAHIDFEAPDCLTAEEKTLIASSLQQFQRGEHSEGKHLFAFAKKFPDPAYLECIRLFIPEEQMHARVLERFMKRYAIPVIKGHWVDGVFRALRKMAGIENTVRVLLVAETIAKVYYGGLYHVTGSALLKKICAQILSDEEQHIRFQCDALRVFHQQKSFFSRFFTWWWQWILMTGTILVVWWHHKKVLKKGGYYFGRFFLENLLVFSAAERSIRQKETGLLRKEIIAA
jgi:hypothetical protein